METTIEQKIEYILQLEQQHKFAEALKAGKQLLAQFRYARKIAKRIKNSLLLILARISSILHKKECLSYCDEITRSLTDSDEDISMLAKVVFIQSNYLLHEEKREEAETNLVKVQMSIVHNTSLPKKEKDIILATVAMHLGNIKVSLPNDHNVRTAIPYYEYAIPIFREYNEQRSLITTLINCSGVELELGNIQKAELLLDEAITLLKDVNNLRSLSTALIRKANILEEKSCYKDSIAVLNEALPLVCEYTERNLSNVITHLQSICYTLGLYTECITLYKHLEKIMQYNNNIQNSVMLFYTHYWAIRSFIAQEQYTLALPLFSTLRNMEFIEENSEFSLVLLYLEAVVYFHEGNTKKAELFIELTKNVETQNSSQNIMQLIAVADILSLYNATFWKKRITDILNTVTNLEIIESPTQRMQIAQMALHIYKRLPTINIPNDKILQQYLPTTLLETDNNDIRQNLKNMFHTLTYLQLRYAEEALLSTKTSLKNVESTLLQLQTSYQQQADNNTQLLDVLRTIYRYLTIKPMNTDACIDIINNFTLQKSSIFPQSDSEGKIPECPAELRTLLLRQNNKLTPKELSFCFLTLEGYDLQQMETMFKVSLAGIRKIRYRLARKLQVPANTVFYQFLLELTGKQ